MYEISTDEELIASFQSGADIRAFEELYKRYWFKLYNVAVGKTTSRQEAEELIQTIFERLWANREKAVVKNIGAYLAVSLRNILLDHQRRKLSAEKFKQSLTPEPAANATEEEVDRTLLLNTIETSLRELPEKTQTVFRLSRYENKSVREIAGNLHLTEKAVEYHITKALKLLRIRLKGYLHIFF